MIAIDYAWNLGPDYRIPEADRGKLDLMLRSSDDAAASEFWSRNGGAAIVERMVTRLHLCDSAPPPVGRGWGSTAVSAEDMVRIYRYLLDRAPAPVRDLVMGNLHRATRCGTDGFDQSFGIPAAFKGVRSYKQGWLNFGDAPRDPCTEGVSARSVAPRQSRGDEIDYRSGALHTTGTVGARDRTIVVVLSLHTPGTGYKQAFYNLTMLTRSLKVPDVKLAPPLPQPPPGKWFGTWNTNVAVRADATNGSAQVGTVPSGVEVQVRCQVRGEEVVYGDIRNDWWTYLPEFGGYMSNVFFDYPDNRLPDVPDC
jgi:hypothetical protein